MADALTWVFRFVHIASAVTWVGGAALWTMIIAPNVLQRGPPPLRRPFLEATLAKVTRFFISSAILTILTGLVLMGVLVSWENLIDVFQGGGDYPPSYGIALGIGLVASVIMAIEGTAIIQPTGKKLLATMQSVPPGALPSPETQAQLAALGKKVGIAGMTTMVLGFVALGAMVWAVNVVR